MAIPGLNAFVQPRGKVRIGERRVSGGGRDYPASVDYFRSDDPELEQLFGSQPKTIRVRLALDDVADVFSTGLEWWTRTQGTDSALLGCYTKDGSADPTALRYKHFVAPEDEVRGEEVGQGRVPIKCLARQCPIFKKKDCRPMGRLLFYLDGGRTDVPLVIETKSFNSIERAIAVLRGARLTGPLLGRVFEVSVAFEQEGEKRYPVLGLREVVEGAPGAAGGAAGAGAPSTTDPDAPTAEERAELITLIEARGANPRDPHVANWVKDVGIRQALRNLKETMADG
jgi:hypothetical protein